MARIIAHIFGVLVSLLVVVAIIYWAFFIFALLRDGREENRRNKEIGCTQEGGIYSEYYGCETPYEVCLRKVRRTFADLSDTWGNNTNNQDSISKTMRDEIGRCMENTVRNPLVK